MDIAHQLAALRAQPPAELLKSVNRYLPPVVTLILLAAVAYLAAQLTWRLVPTQADAAPLPPIAAPAAGGAGGGGSIDASRIVNRHPFGIAAPPETKPEVRVSDAPVTTQPLKLHGTVTEDEAEDGVSFTLIATNRSVERYVVGDSVKDVNNVRIVEIGTHEVLLNVNGRMEKLTFCSAATAGTRGCQSLGSGIVSTGRPVSAPVTQTPTVNVQPQPRTSDDQRQLAGSNLQVLANIVRPTPVEQDGMKGIQVSSGADRETFEALGFKDKDVVLNVNGSPIADVRDGMKLLETLGDTNTTTVTVLRDGGQHTITLDTTRIRSILENRE